MNNLKDILGRLLIIIFIIAGGVTAICKAFNELFPAVLWVVSFDYKDTGLSFIEETIVKAIVENIIIAIAISNGISRKNPLVSLVVIIIGFAVCVLIYFIKQYLLWIMIGLITLLVVYIIHLVVSNHRKKAEV